MTPPVTPAIFYDADGYVTAGRLVMGRQSAGAGFLRAAVAGRGEAPVTAYAPRGDQGPSFRALVAQFDPAAATAVIGGRDLGRISELGLFYRPDLLLGAAARQRLRVGPAAYSLCGVTHTLASALSLDSLARMVTEPVMAWDAVICTSAVARDVVTAVFEEAQAQHRWRFGAGAAGPLPMTPVIPLGVHTDDFAFSDADQSAARESLGLAADEVAVLSAGRLSTHAKAHPYATLHALQAVAETTGVRLVLMFAGQAFNADIAEVFRTAAATFAPDVRTVFVDGGQAHAYRSAWAAADLFISLADNIQETFGLTPVEAMAAGLPALVSDWNGYKDTVRDGLDGFRITTWAPPPGAGARLAMDYESGAKGYDEYLYHSMGAVAVDLDSLIARLTRLVTEPELRRALGASGQARARAVFDWRHIYRRYQDLWAEQADLRAAARADPATQAWLARAPARGPDQMGPFDTFETYPTHKVTPQTRMTLRRDLTPEAYGAWVADPLLARAVPPAAAYEVFRAALQAGPTTVQALIEGSGIAPLDAMELAARLAKLGLLRLEPGEDQVSSPSQWSR